MILLLKFYNIKRKKRLWTKINYNFSKLFFLFLLLIFLQLAKDPLLSLFTSAVLPREWTKLSWLILLSSALCSGGKIYRFNRSVTNSIKMKSAINYFRVRKIGVTPKSRNLIFYAPFDLQKFFANTPWKIYFPEKFLWRNQR